MKMFHIIGYVPTGEWESPEDLLRLRSYHCSDEVPTLAKAESLTKIEAWYDHVQWDRKSTQERDRLIDEWCVEQKARDISTWETVYKFATNGELVWR